MSTTLFNGKNQLSVDFFENNVHIYNSHSVPTEDIDTWVQIIKSAGEEHGFTYPRSEKSWVCEWKAHNVLFKWGIAKERTGDVDLDNAETVLRRIGYWFLSLMT